MGSSKYVDLTSLTQHPIQQLKRVWSNCWKAENPCLQTALIDQAYYQTQDEACSLNQNIQMGCKSFSISRQRVMVKGTKGSCIQSSNTRKKMSSSNRFSNVYPEVPASCHHFLVLFPTKYHQSFSSHLNRKIMALLQWVYWHLFRL